MPRHKKQTLLAILIILVIAAVACSGDPDPESAVETVSNTGNYETCVGFLDAQSVEEQTNVEGLTDRVRVIDVASIPGLVESGAINNCLVEVYRTLGGDDAPKPGESVSLSLVRFEDSDLAKRLYNSTLASAILTAEQLDDLVEIQQGVISRDSYFMDVKVGGIGALVVFVFDTTFVSMSSTADDESNALFDRESLVNAAQSVQSRLP
ncbi:MAG: hypothetical protein V3T49_08935 [Dehalococcoidia bacterium]